MPLELNPEIYRAVLDSLPIGVYLTDLKRQIAFWNAQAERLTGYLGQEVIGRFCNDKILMHCDENQNALCGADCPMVQAMHEGRPREAGIFLRHKDGQRIPVRVRTVPVRDEFGAVIGAAEFFEQRGFRGVDLRASRILMDFDLDEATEIPDHRALVSGLEAALDAFAVSRSSFGLLVITIDNLDHLRRVDGCQAVREALYAVAQTLCAGTRPDDLVGRWSDDRFAAIVACEDADSLRSCARKLRRLVSLAAIPWWGDRLSVTVSMGGAIVGRDDTAACLWERAERALVLARSLPEEPVQVI